MSAQDAREARRRKILARGVDRLAYITGERSSIPSMSPASGLSSTDAHVPASSHSHASGDSALIRLADRSPDRQPEVQKSDVVEFDALASTRLLKNAQEQLKSLDMAGTRGHEIEVAPTFQATIKEEKSFSAAENCDQGVHQKSFKHLNPLRGSKPQVSWDAINHSIDSTESIRALLALLVALIVVAPSTLACTGFQQNFISNLVLPWPIACIAVTDITCIVSALLLGSVKLPTQGDGEAASEEAQDLFKQFYGLAMQLGGYLEVLLGILKASRALFLDWSIYIVAITCGFSFTAKWLPLVCTIYDQ